MFCTASVLWLDLVFPCGLKSNHTFGSPSDRSAFLTVKCYFPPIYFVFAETNRRTVTHTQNGVSCADGSTWVPLLMRMSSLMSLREHGQSVCRKFISEHFNMMLIGVTPVFKSIKLLNFSLTNTLPKKSLLLIKLYFNLLLICFFELPFILQTVISTVLLLLTLTLFVPNRKSCCDTFVYCLAQRANW